MFCFVLVQGSLALNSTDQGSSSAPLQCASVAKWKGGDLYVRVKPVHVVPVDFSISINVEPADRTLAVTANYKAKKVAE